MVCCTDLLPFAVHVTTHTHTHTYIHTHAYIRTYIHTCIHIYTHIDNAESEFFFDVMRQIMVIWKRPLVEVLM